MGMGGNGNGIEWEWNSHTLMGCNNACVLCLILIIIGNKKPRMDDKGEDVKEDLQQRGNDVQKVAECVNSRQEASTHRYKPIIGSTSRMRTDASQKKENRRCNQLKLLSWLAA